MSDAFPGDSIVGSGSAAAPGAGVVIADVVLPNGVYRVKILIEMTGTAEAAARNLRLVNTGVAVANVEDLPSNVTGQDVEIEIPELTINQSSGSGQLDVRTIAAATAGAVYNAQIIADRIR